MKEFIIILLLSAGILNSQNIYTIAGSGTNGSSGDGASSVAAQIGLVEGPVAVDAFGNVYIPDWSNNRVRKVDAATGNISTIAGTGVSGYNGDSIPATNAQLKSPSSIAIDSQGNIYIAEYSGYRIRKVELSTGLIFTVAGTGTYGYNGDNISAKTAQLTECTGIAIDTNGNIFISDMGNQRIRRIDKIAGLITTIAGTGASGFNGDGITASNAQVNMPFGIDVSSSGDVYFADRSNNRVRKVSSGIISTVAGDGTLNSSIDGVVANANPIYNPYSVAVDYAGNIFIAESQENKIRKVNTSGTLSTVAGNGNFGYSGDGNDADSAMLAYPRGIAVDDCGSLYISDRNNYRIRKVSSFLVTSNVSNVSCNSSCNGSISILASAGSQPYTYAWNSGLGISNSVSSLCPGSYFVCVTDASGCKEFSFATITQPPAINASVTVVSANCAADGSATVNASGGAGNLTYLWSNGMTTSTISNVPAGNYSVTVTDANNCTVIQNANIQNSQITFASAPICMVTVDSNSQYNQITWDKTMYSNVDSFIIYRETATNIYQRIAALPYSSLSMFTDTVQTLYFPNTGNPNVGSYRYKIQTVDSCERYSQLSLYHNTIFITCSNGTFSWPQLYTIESSPNPVLSYALFRDNISDGNWQTIGSVAGTQQSITDPMYSTYQNTATWRIQTQWSISCTPTYKIQQNVSSSINSSISNKFSNLTTGVAPNNNIENIKLYPTANDGTFFIETPNKTRVIIYSSMGQTIDAADLGPGRNQLNFNHLSAGTYIIKLISNDGVATTRIIVE